MKNRNRSRYSWLLWVFPCGCEPPVTCGPRYIPRELPSLESELGVLFYEVGVAGWSVGFWLVAMGFRFGSVRLQCIRSVFGAITVYERLVNSGETGPWRRNRPNNTRRFSFSTEPCFKYAFTKRVGDCTKGRYTVASEGKVL